MPAWRILSFARTSRLPIAAGDDEECRRDGLCIEAENDLQDYRRADTGVDCGMGAGEHQRETLIGNFRGARGGVQAFGHDCRCFGGMIVAVASSMAVDRLSAGDGEQPGLGILRDSR